MINVSKGESAMYLFIQHKNKLLVITAICIALAFGLDWRDETTWSNMFYLLATIVASMPILYKAIQASMHRTFSIELLVMIAVIGALFIQEYIEAAMVTFLFLLGDFLEARTLRKTRSSLQALLDLQPEEAIVLENNIEYKVPTEQVKVGQKIRIKPGGKVPVDGEVYDGSASIMEASITGESIPAVKTIGHHVYAGTIVEDGYIEMYATKVGEDTTYAKIINLVEEAQETKTKAERFLNRFASIYTPSIIVLAILVYLLTKEISIAITFLVIACPGALVIGAPVSTVVGIGNGAKHGALIKGGEVLDRLRKIDTLFFDKTGTLTKGKPEVTNITVYGSMDRQTLLQYVAIAEKRSEHHLGKTIVQQAKKEKIDISKDASIVTFVKGKGVKAVLSNKKLYIGNRKLMLKEDILLPEEVLNDATTQEQIGSTVIFVAMDQKVVGMIAIVDQIREDAVSAIQQLRNSGVKNVMMLTGDNRHTAKMVANRLELDGFKAELLPEDKAEIIKQMQAKGHMIAMVGDGVNDAPAIARADIGLAMGEGGTDVAMETADIVLMADQLSHFAHAHSLAKVTIRNMKQNIAIAMLTVAFLLIGVLQGHIHLANGMFIHEASVLLVILNAMRLHHFRSNQKGNNPIFHFMKARRKQHAPIGM
jgi:Zn2+/Cd2+-exporting ATPase